MEVETKGSERRCFIESSAEADQQGWDPTWIQLLDLWPEIIN